MNYKFGDTTRIKAAKRAAQSFVNTLDKNCYVSVATFGEWGSKMIDWTQLSDEGRAGINNSIGAITIPDAHGTNMQDGLNKASEYLTSNAISFIPEENRVTVLISDGQPTYCMNNGTREGFGDMCSEKIYNSTLAEAEKTPGEKYAVYIGKLDDVCYYEKYNKDNSNTGKLYVCNDYINSAGSLDEINDAVYYDVYHKHRFSGNNFGNCSICKKPWYEHTLINFKGENPHTVNDLLTAITGDSEKVLGAEDTEALIEKLNSIASTIETSHSGHDGSGWTVTDDLNELFMFKEVIKGGENKDTVQDDGDKVKWNITNKDLVEKTEEGNKTKYTYNATYRITLKTSDSKFKDYDEEGDDESGKNPTVYPTSDSTVLKAGDDVVSTFDNPTTVKGTAEWYYYDVNVKVQTADAEGKLKYDEAPYYIFDEQSEYRNKARVNTKVVNSSYEPKEGEIAGKDYIMLPDAYTDIAELAETVSGKLTPKNSSELNRYSVAENPGVDNDDDAIIGNITGNNSYEYVYDLNPASVTVKHYYVNYGYIVAEDKDKFVDYEEAKAAAQADETKTEIISGYIGDSKTISKKDKDSYTFEAGETGEITLTGENNKVYELYYKADKAAETVYYVINEHFGTRKRVIEENGEEKLFPANYTGLPGQTNPLRSDKGIAVPETPSSAPYNEAVPAYNRVTIKVDEQTVAPETLTDGKLYPKSTDENKPTVIDIYYENEVDERGEPITIVVKHQYIEMAYEIDENGHRSAEPKASAPVLGDTDTFTVYKGQYIDISEKPNGYTPDAGNAAILAQFVNSENEPDYAYHKVTGEEPCKEITLSYSKFINEPAAVTVTHKYIPYTTVTVYEKDEDGNIISWRNQEKRDEEHITEFAVVYGAEGTDTDDTHYVPGPYYEGEKVAVEMRPDGFTPCDDVQGKIADVRANNQTIELVYEKHDNDQRDEADYQIYHRFYYSEKYIDKNGEEKTREVYERGNDAPAASGKEKIGTKLPVEQPEYSGYTVRPGAPYEKTIEPGLNAVYVDYVRETGETAVIPEVTYVYYERHAEIVDGEFVWSDYEKLGEPVTFALPETYIGRTINIPFGNSEEYESGNYKDLINGEKHIYTQTVAADNYKFTYEYGKSVNEMEKLPVAVNHYSGKAYVEGGVSHEPAYYSDFALIEGEGKSSDEYKNVVYTAEALTGRRLDRIEVIKGESEAAEKTTYSPEQLADGKLKVTVDAAAAINFYYVEDVRVPSSYEVWTKTRTYNITVNGTLLVSDPEFIKDKDYKGYAEEKHDLTEFFADKTVESAVYKGEYTRHEGVFNEKDKIITLGDGTNIVYIIYKEELDARKPGKVEIRHIYNEYDETAGETRMIDSKTTYPHADEKIWIDGTYSYELPEEDKLGYDKVEIDRTEITVKEDSSENVITVIYTKNVNPKPHEYVVSYDSKGGSDVPAETVKEGEKATEPADPTREGFDFDGWYLGGEKYDFDTPVTSDITLTAKWTEKPATPVTPVYPYPSYPVVVPGVPTPAPTQDAQAELPDAGVPLADAPETPTADTVSDGVELGDDDVPLAAAPSVEDEEELEDDLVPLGEAPSTGDSGHIVLYAIIMLVCAAGLVVIALTSRKKKNDARR